MKLFSIGYKDWAFNLGMLILRLAAGGLLIPHGYNKIVHFAEMKSKFMNFMGIGTTMSLSLVIFAEFFCAIFIVLGLMTRFFAIPPIIAMAVALFKAHNGQVFGDGAEATFFLASYLVILLCGPGKASVDGLINK